MACIICGGDVGHPKWVLCGTGHCDECCRECRFCMAELRADSW